MALKGFPVVVVAEGGAPFVLVESGAPLATVAENGMGTPITPVTANAPPLVLSDPILSIFADGTDGFYFDFSKTDRLFQNINGTTPADDPGENIALALESHAWQGRTLSEVLAGKPTLYDDFSTYDNTAAMLAAGWTASGATVTLDAEAIRVENPNANFNGAYRSFATVAGQTYRISGTRVARGGGATGGDYSVGTTIGGSNLVGVSSWSVGARYFVATGTTTYLFLRAGDNVSGAWTSHDDISIVPVPGNHGRQATTAFQPKYQTGGLARFDGSDDNLLTALNPAASFSMMFKGKITSASKIVMGSRATTDTRAFIGTDAAGLLAAGVGADSTTTIKGGSDIRGTTGVGALVYSASGVELYWNGVSVYSGALNGSPNTTIPLALGALNDNGTASTFADADIYYALAIKKALTAAGIQAITNLWGTT